jgi:anti-anti-sigma factor
MRAGTRSPGKSPGKPSRPIPEPWLTHEQLGDGAQLVRFAGELDIASCEAFSAALDAAIASGAPLIVDLGGCRFIDSTGIAALLRARRDQRRDGAGIAVVGARDQVARVFGLCGVDRELALHTTVEEALEAINAGA